jgi:hypothetical protein
MSDKDKISNVEAEVTMPFGFTDAVKAIREALGLVGDMLSMVGNVSIAYQQHKGKKAADHLDTLAFRPDGSFRHLERIAEGNGQPEDFKAIAEKMDETGGQIEKALDRLNAHRAFVRRRFGAQIANKIDGMIYAGRGKQSIRVDLVTLAGMDHQHYSAEEIAAEARVIMSNIGQLNNDLAEVHDILAAIVKT